MADIPTRVDKLEGTVSTHHQVLFGPEGCPEVGMVKQFDQIKELTTKQTVYNKIMTFFASALALTVIGYLFSLVFK